LGALEDTLNWTSEFDVLGVLVGPARCPSTNEFASGIGGVLGSICPRAFMWPVHSVSAALATCCQTFPLRPMVFEAFLVLYVIGFPQVTSCWYGFLTLTGVNRDCTVRSSPPAMADTTTTSVLSRSEEHTSELQSPYVISYAVFCL